MVTPEMETEVVGAKTSKTLSPPRYVSHGDNGGGAGAGAVDGQVAGDVVVVTGVGVFPAGQGVGVGSGRENDHIGPGQGVCLINRRPKSADAPSILANAITRIGVIGVGCTVDVKGGRQG